MKFGMKAISLFQALKNTMTKKAEAKTPPPAPTVDTSYLRKFAHVSDDLKKEIVKTASAMGHSRRDIYDMVSDLDKNSQLQKQADYIKWYKQITSS
jgi:hypothetical protein